MLEMGGLNPGIRLAPSQSSFVFPTRLPKEGDFNRGVIFDAAGILHEYHGLTGFPALPRRFAKFLEILILPVLLFSIYKRLVFVGPKLSSSEMLSLRPYKESLVRASSRFGTSSEIRILESHLEDAECLTDVYDLYENWIYGGLPRSPDRRR